MDQAVKQWFMLDGTTFDFLQDANDLCEVVVEQVCMSFS